MTNSLLDVQRKTIVRLVDDDESFLSSMKILLQMKGWTTRCYTRASDFLQNDIMSFPGVLILDIRMPGTTGLELLGSLEKTGNILSVVMLSGHGDIETAVHTLKHGAQDFLEKPVKPAKLFAVVEKAAARSLDEYTKQKELADLKNRFISLTKREREIFISACRGQSNKEIGDSLGIGVGTVKMHRANAFGKMGVHSSTEASNLLQRINWDA